jgi:hypothetical protein
MGGESVLKLEDEREAATGYAATPVQSELNG